MNQLTLTPWTGLDCPVNLSEPVIAEVRGEGLVCKPAAEVAWQRVIGYVLLNSLKTLISSKPARDLIKVGEEYVTTFGRPVTIYRTDAGGNHPVHYAVQCKDGTWVSGTTDIYGSGGDGKPYLVKKP
jgi:hypothetical protein